MNSAATADAAFEWELELAQFAVRNQLMRSFGGLGSAKAAVPANASLIARRPTTLKHMYCLFIDANSYRTMLYGQAKLVPAALFAQGTSLIAESSSGPCYLGPYRAAYMAERSGIRTIIVANGASFSTYGSSSIFLSILVQLGSI